MINGVLKRKVEWPSREVAERTLVKAFSGWDKRILEKLKAYALYPYPTETIAPETATSGRKDVEVVRTRILTGRYQELTSILRPSFIDSEDVAAKNEETSYAKEARLIHNLIPHVPCATLYVCMWREELDIRT